MAKASTILRAFNGGEWSPTVEGRVDLDRYPSSLRESVNGILTPQGAWVGRSGTAFVQPALQEAFPSTLIPFTYSFDKSLILEFTQNQLAFLDENGVVGYPPVAATAIVEDGGATFTFSFPGGKPATLYAGTALIVTDANPACNLNGVRMRIGRETATTVSVAATPGMVVPTGAVSVVPVYTILTPYTADEARSLRFVSDLNTIYLLSPLRRPYKLQRFGALDWRLAAQEFQGGPMLPVNFTGTRISANRSGTLIPPMSSATVTGYRGETITVSGEVAAVDGMSGETHEIWKAFDGNTQTSYWGGGSTSQKGYIDVDFGVDTVVTGYSILVPSNGRDTDYTPKDFSPMNFSLLASKTGNIADFVVIDQQTGYVLYDNSSSEHFRTKSSETYRRFRLEITALQRNGPIFPRIAELQLVGPNVPIALTATTNVGINGDRGFVDADVGRLISIRGIDGRRRMFEITAAESPTRVLVGPQGGALPDLTPTTEWALGYWSDTTGWPTCGTILDQRLWLGGGVEYPDVLAGSAIRNYDDFSTSTPAGEVLEDNAFVGQLSSRQVAAITWISADQRGLLVGTTSGEWTVSGDSNGVINAKTAKARNATARGCANIEPARVDAQVLYIQRARKTIREFTYQFQTDGYRSPSMSLFAAHLGAIPFVELEYAAEPNSIVWARREDGRIRGLTYNREEDVIGWHSHDLSGLFVESIAVKPSTDGTHDVLWLSGRRTVNGVQRRFIERLVKAWDFDQQGDPRNAHFVDCGSRYIGPPVEVLYGLLHLEGATVYGLADGSPTGPMIVQNGSVTLPRGPASNIVVGLGFDAYFRTARIEGGAADGTGQGKTKRMHNIGFRLWQSCGFRFGVEGAPLADAVLRRTDELVGQPVELFTGDTGPLLPEANYEMSGSITVLRPKEDPRPLNVLAIMPQFLTQDR